jgi:phage shock protein E
MAAPNPRFHQLVADAKTRIREVSAQDAAARQKAGATLIDVREASDYTKEHADAALGISKGVVELKIEETIPDTGKEIICYCGGGSRSALVADNLQKMGYTNVASMTGGFKAWKEQGLPTTP